MNAYITCPTCEKQYEQPLDQCTYCNYPFSAPEEIRSEFVVKHVEAQALYDDSVRNVKWARTIFFIVSLFNTGFGVYYIMQQDIFPAILGFLVGIVFGIFAALIYRDPLSICISGLVVMVLLYILAAIGDPVSIVRGFIWKLLFLLGTITAVVKVYKLERLRKQSPYFADLPLSKK